MTSLLSSPPLVRPDHASWESARSTFNLLDDLQPEAFVFPESADDVVAAVGEARRLGLQVAVQATGHNAAALGDAAGTLVVNTSRLRGIDVDPGTGLVRVGAGVKWESVTPTLSDLGFAGLHGSSPDVGIAGYSLGGGIGWLARTHGMQTNKVTAVEIVTADGRLRRVDADHEPELFWALRGGNGNFGVVTALEFATVPLPELYAGAYFYPVERTREVLGAWTALMPSLPEEMNTWVSVIHFPPDPMLPEFARGQSLVALMAAYAGPESAGRALLAPMRRLGPTLDTFAMQRTAALGDLAMDPVEPLPYRSTTALLDELTPDLADSLVSLTGRGSPIVLLQLRHLGGALSRALPTAGARATLPGKVCLFALGVVPDEPTGIALAGALESMDRAVAPHRVGHYPNFVEHPADASTFFDAVTWERLRRAKAAYDPADLFRGNHHVTPLG